MKTTLLVQYTRLNRHVLTCSFSLGLIGMGFLYTSECLRSGYELAPDK
ncbi:MAG: hypothetical protein AABY38_02335 [Planctomycetota bacterium]